MNFPYHVGILSYDVLPNFEKFSFTFLRVLYSEVFFDLHFVIVIILRKILRIYKCN